MLNDSAQTDAASQPGRIAALLGIEDAPTLDDVALADRVADGLSPQAATALGATLGPMIAVVGDIVPESTFRRVRKARGALSREMSERLYEIGRVWEAARRSYGGDEEAARAFLVRSHPMLDGRAPMDLARRSSAGADAVMNLLRRAEAGFAV